MLLLFLVFGAMLFGLAHKLLDLGVRQPGGRLNANLLLFAGRFILGRHMHDAVGVDVEGDLDLRDSAGSRRDIFQVEFTQRLIIRRSEERRVGKECRSRWSRVEYMED